MKKEIFAMLLIVFAVGLIIGSLCFPTTITITERVIEEPIITPNTINYSVEDGVTVVEIMFYDIKAGENNTAKIG